jgi:hypothetical protein
MTPKDPLWDVLLEVDFRVLEKDGYEPQVRGGDVVVLAHLHCLPSIVRLFYILLTQDLSVPAKQVILIPKPYSTIPSAADEVRKLGINIIRTDSQFRLGRYDEAVSSHLKEGCRKAHHICCDIVKKGRKPRLVLVDDGGMLTETWWRLFHSSEFEAVSVQQTASGVRREPKPSKLVKIDVARSAAKRRFEAKIISEGVLRKVRDLDIMRGVDRVGVAGIGALGCALAQSLTELHKQVHIYDVKQYCCKPDGAKIATGLGNLLRQSDVLFGCTGRNFLRLGALEKIKHKLQLVSCSSRDVEFLDLLRLGKIEKYQSNDPFGPLQVKLGEHTHSIANGGFPINFDRKEEAETAEQIVLTRALVLSGIFQALCVKSGRYWKDALKLSPSIQKALVLKWLGLTGQSAETFVSGGDGAIGDLNWWRENSFGEEPASEPVQVRAALGETETARRASALVSERRQRLASSQIQKLPAL